MQPAEGAVLGPGEGLDEAGPGGAAGRAGQGEALGVDELDDLGVRERRGEVEGHRAARLVEPAQGRQGAAQQQLEVVELTR